MMRTILFAVSLVWLGACSSDVETTDTADEINCAVDADCSSVVGGGVCGPTTHTCHPINRCASSIDCTLPDVCVRSSVFGALCAQPNTAPAPQPVASCHLNADCPSWQLCGPDSRCHARYCATNDQCPTGETCHPICPTDPLSTPTPSTASLGGICQPSGVLIEQCPIQQDPLPPDAGTSVPPPPPTSHN
jgi:hypothetical protein